MVWVFVVVALTIVYLALRFRKFQSWVEPVLTIAVAIGLVVALVIWLAEDRYLSTGEPVSSAETSAIAADAITVTDLQFIPGKPSTSYRVVGQISNTANVTLQSFRLDVELSDCPADSCRVVGKDSALIIARVPPGETLPFTTFAVFPGSDVPPVTSPKWDWTIGNIRAYDR